MESKQAMMRSTFLPLDLIRREARQFFHNARGSHDWEHSERVARLAVFLAGREQADTGIVEAASLLHDIGREAEFESGGRQCHARTGAMMARGLLERLGVETGIRERIVHCIAAHRFRGTNRPESPEARVLFDADKLDSIGATGIGRAFLFAGEVGATLHDPDVDPAATSSYSREDTAFREFKVKLQFIRERMLTETGREIAIGRHEFMVSFFDRLTRETLGQM